jgi:hypothetical protein
MNTRKKNDSSGKNWLLPCAAGLFIISVTLYILTLCPGVYWYDSGELQAAVPTLGIPHSPSFPSYILSTHFFWWLPFGDMAYRVNLGTAVAGGVVSVLGFFLAIKLFGSINNLNVLTAFISGLAVSMNSIIWFQNTKAEVYSLNTALLLILLALCINSVDNSDNRRTVFRNMSLAALLLGLGGTNHSLLTAHMVPAVLLALMFVFRKIRLKEIMFAALIALLTLSVYIYLPLRAVKNPRMNIGNPENWMNFFNAVSRRGSYGRFMGNQLHEWLQNWSEYVVFVSEHLSVAFLIVSVIGLIILLIQRVKPTAILVVAALTNISVTLTNRNFNMNPDTGPAYLMISTVILITGFAGFFRLLLQCFSKPNRYYAVRVCLFLGAFSIPVVWSYENLKTGGLADDTSAANVGKALLDLTPENSILFHGAYFNLPFVSSYLQTIEHYRRDVIHINRLEIVYWPGGLQRLTKTYPDVTAVLYSGHRSESLEYLAPRSARHSRRYSFEEARDILFNATAWLAYEHTEKYHVFWFSSEDDHLLRVQLNPHGPMLKLGEPLTGQHIFSSTHDFLSRRIQFEETNRFYSKRASEVLGGFYDLQCTTMFRRQLYQDALSARERSVLYDPEIVGFCTFVDFDSIYQKTATD